MAKHFRQDADKTARRQRPASARAGSSVAKTWRQERVRTATVTRGGAQERRRPTPYGEDAPLRYGHVEPARRNDLYLSDDVEYARGGIHRVGRGFFLLLAVCARLAALALFAIVMLNAMPIPPIAHYVAAVTQFVTEQLPWHDIRILAVDTPFGGSFRCDLCLLSLFLFVLDWLFCRLRAALV